MTNKLYYTDPLKAALMAREHGVHFTEPLAFGFHNGQYVIARSPHLDMSRDAKYYIHPDSLPIFDVRDGDLVEFFGEFDNLYGIAKVDGKRVSLAGWTCNEHHYNRIIQRDNKAFFTPEVQL